MDTRDGGWPEFTEEDIDTGSLEEVNELRLDMSNGIGDWAQEPPEEPKLESNDTSEPELLWENVSEARLFEIVGELEFRPDRD